MHSNNLPDVHHWCDFEMASTHPVANQKTRSTQMAFQSEPIKKHLNDQMASLPLEANQNAGWRWILIIN